jgi:hypothetical protein
MRIPESPAQTSIRRCALPSPAISRCSECMDAMTGEPRYVICAIARDRADYVITPSGHLAPGNPYEACESPLTSPDPGEPAAARE